ncbi:tripartite motif-containing protein 16-like [Triplophysa rosa]|uniref:Tripartite motif-containing protein 16-like n=1 Tax=Triplophysa rosa TaxID=992332 RepID=A0A9W7TCQ8_TRIRA|nr:tripartite motif-containing protein 16-like [Triplophysa rosa]KAI7794366.1 putative tripartite motif-containing protein 16-like [Triplophysa rosa]
MAEASISWVQDQFSCSICLDLLKDPVTINCGHSFCMSCITDCWNQEDQKRVYSCPQCRQTFTPRPALGKNVILAEMVEKLKKTKLQTDRAAPSYAGPEDVECDVCTGRKYKAVKSCLVCLNSYCQTHFEYHEEFHSGRRHNVIDATGRLREMICSQHDKQLEIYCRTDHQCICYLCTMDEHRNHDNVAAVVERREKQTALEEIQRIFQQRIQETQKKLQELRESVKSHKRSAQTAVEDTERIFTELIRSIERRRSEVIQLIRDQEKTGVSQAEGLLKEVEQDIDDLKRRDTELQQLSETDDHIYFLQSFLPLSTPPGSTDNITVSSPLSFDDVRNSVSQLKEIVEDFCKKEIDRISAKVSYSENIPNGLNSRAELLQYSRQFSLDPNTAHKNLCLSEGNRAATCTGTAQQYPDHPDRFDYYYEVLCRESVCGRCYWEVELSGIDSVSISVSYKNISRKGNTDESKFGYSDQSWRFLFTPSRYSFWHNKIQTNVPVVSSSSRIGVYVDHSAGILSFYSVSDTMTLIHRVHTTFTQPLYPGFWLNLGTSVKLY